MNNMPLKLRRECEADPYYQTCARSNGDCKGRITYEHALIYAGKQVQEKFAIIPLCEFHHLGTGLVKKINEIIAYGRATIEDIKKYPLFPWKLYGLSHSQ
jgi:hypothetical protein